MAGLASQLIYGCISAPPAAADPLTPPPRSAGSPGLLTLHTPTSRPPLAGVGEMSTSTEDGYEHTGAALLPEGSQLATTDADYCALACALVQSCGAWKFAPDTSVCELLHGSGELQPNPGYTSGVISGEAALGVGGCSGTCGKGAASGAKGEGGCRY